MDKDFLDLLYDNRDINEIVNEKVDEELRNRSKIRTKINPYIADDVKSLKQHYTILLNYSRELERKCCELKKDLVLANRTIRWQNIKIQEYERDNENGICSEE